MELLTLGRHFRIGPATKIVLGRNELENLMLEGHAQAGYTCLRPKFAGPAALLVGEDAPEGRETAVTLILQHTKAEKRPVGVAEFWVNGISWSVEPRETMVSV
jgi:hypothetical protein